MMSTCRDGCCCRGGNLELSGAGCQVLVADLLRSRHGESEVLEGGEATYASLETKFLLN